MTFFVCSGGRSGGRPRAVIIGTREGVARPAAVCSSIFFSRIFTSFMLTDLVIAGGVGFRSLAPDGGDVSREGGVFCSLARFFLLYSRCLGDVMSICERDFGDDGVDEGGVEEGDGEGDFGGVFVCLGGD